jgi:hypothetical protein
LEVVYEVCLTAESAIAVGTDEGFGRAFAQGLFPSTSIDNTGAGISVLALRAVSAIVDVVGGYCPFVVAFDMLPTLKVDAVN